MAKGMNEKQRVEKVENFKEIILKLNFNILELEEKLRALKLQRRYKLRILKDLINIPKELKKIADSL